MACVAYSLAVLTLLFEPDPGAAADGSNLVPFRSVRLQLRHGFTRQLVGNFLLLAPVGFTLRYWGVRLRSIFVGLVAIAVGVELSQVLVDRVSDVDDVILNVTGGMAGAVLALVLLRFARHARLRRSPRV